MVAFRYLRARNAQRSISVIAGFSFLGIVLGVAALIVVMSVMNGFRHDLMDKMIGLNGHMFLQGGRDAAHRLRRGDAAREQGSRRHFGAAAGRGPGVRELPLRLVRRAGARHSRKRSRASARRRRPYHPGLARRLRFRPGRGGRLQARRTSELEGRRQDHHHRAAWRGDAVRRHAAHEELYGRGHLPDRHDDLRQHLHLHAARRGSDLLQSGRPGERDRGLCRRSRQYGRDAGAKSSRRRGGR